MLRVRLTYAKRGRACFIPHIAIPSVFTRSGGRAGVKFQLSEGFSPRPRISLGPELPVGVPALNEPFEVRVASLTARDLSRWDLALPGGFFFTGALVESVPGTGSLNGQCEAASYLLALRGRDSTPLDAALAEMREEGLILHYREDAGPCFRCVVDNPARGGPGLFVKEFAKRGIIRGWADLFMLRESVGRLVEQADLAPCVIPLADPSAHGWRPLADGNISKGGA